MALKRPVFENQLCMRYGNRQTGRHLHLDFSHIKHAQT